MFQRIKSNNSIAVKKAIDVLNDGGVIIYPTDTIYGFGCNANNHSAIKKINLFTKIPQRLKNPYYRDV